MTLYSARRGRTRYPGFIDPKAERFLPSSISDLDAWYEARRISGYNNGNSISTFPDLSGNGRNLTGSATYVISSGIALIDSDDMQANRPASGHSSFSFVIHGDGYNADGTLFGIGSTQATRNSCNVCIDHLYCWGTDPSFTSMGTTPFYTITVVYEKYGSNVLIYKNKTLNQTLVTGGMDIDAGIYMFRWFNNDRQSTLRASLGLVYSRALTQSQINDIVDYAATTTS